MPNSVRWRRVADIMATAAASCRSCRRLCRRIWILVCMASSCRSCRRLCWHIGILVCMASSRGRHLRHLRRFLSFSSSSSSSFSLSSLPFLGGRRLLVVVIVVVVVVRHLDQRGVTLFGTPVKGLMRCHFYIVKSRRINNGRGAEKYPAIIPSSSNFRFLR